MNNGDMPAMPNSGEMSYFVERDAGLCGSGLTKREHFAMTAMQGLLVNMGRNGFNDVIEVASEAVNAVDALLSALEGAK